MDGGTGLRVVSQNAKRWPLRARERPTGRHCKNLIFPGFLALHDYEVHQENQKDRANSGNIQKSVKCVSQFRWFFIIVRELSTSNGSQRSPESSFSAFCVHASSVEGRSRDQGQNRACKQYVWASGPPVCVRQLIVLPARGSSANGS